jgi:acyl-homoserine-lactone acylase
MIPALLKAYDETAQGDPMKARLKEPIALLRGWNFRYATDSVPTALAIYWGQNILKTVEVRAAQQHIVKPDWRIFGFVASDASKAELLAALDQATRKLEADFGSWKTPWGEINRFQHLSGAINQAYDDNQPSLPVAFTSSLWGSLAAFGVTTDTGKTKRIYGDKGNSFVAVVEFGPVIHARSILAGGESGDPASAHFNDQADMYSRGEFKEVLFYPDQVRQHSERTYHPGQ